MVGGSVSEGWELGGGCEGGGGEPSLPSVLLTTYGKAWWCLAAPFLPFLVPCSSSDAPGITILRGGTLGPGDSTLLLSSFSLSPPTKDFGLPPLLLPLFPRSEIVM